MQNVRKKKIPRPTASSKSKPRGPYGRETLQKETKVGGKKRALKKAAASEGNTKRKKSGKIHGRKKSSNGKSSRKKKRKQQKGMGPARERGAKYWGRNMRAKNEKNRRTAGGTRAAKKEVHRWGGKMRTTGGEKCSEHHELHKKKGRQMEQTKGCMRNEDPAQKVDRKWVHPTSRRGPQKDDKEAATDQETQNNCHLEGICHIKRLINEEARCKGTYPVKKK